MKHITTILYNEVKFKFISNHYDVHLEGTCIFNNETCYFTNKYPEYDEDTACWEEMFVKIYKLTFKEKIKFAFKQKMFELCIGYHWTYPYRKQGASFYYRKPKWLYVWLFDTYYKVSKKLRG